MAVTKDLGAVTAYAHAKAGGYTGTKAQFEQLMASYGTVAQQAAASATAAAGSASAAADSAEEAQGYAESLDPDTIARVDGYYDTLAAGSAEQLISSIFEEDSEPYNFRTSGGSIDIGDRETDMLVGGSVVWNQLIPLGIDKSKTQNNVTFTDNRDGSYTVQTTAEGASADTYITIASDTTNRGGHVSLLVGAPAGASYTGYRMWDAWGGLGNEYGNGSTGKFVAGGQFEIRISVASGTIITTPVTFRPQLFDITQMFGTTIADYFYNALRLVTGDSKAWFRKLFPKNYYEYNAGELMSVNAVSHDTVGFNAFDKDGVNLKQGSMDVPDSGDRYNVVTGNFIKVVAGVAYCWHQNFAPAGRYVRFYDADQNEIVSARHNIYHLRTEDVFTVPSDAHYIKMAWYSSAGVSINDVKNGEVNLNISWDGERDGEYEEYVKHSYALDDITLRGIPKLDANNNLYYDGDTYESDGTVTRIKGFVQYDGSENWGMETQAGTQSFYIARQSDDTLAVTDITSSAWLCNFCPVGRDTWTVGEMRITGSYYNFVLGSTLNITTLAQWKSYLASHPLQLLYELATPTTEEADPYTNPQIVDDFGTEEYVDGLYSAGTRDVAIPVGHYTQYMPNLKAKLEMAPNSPDGDGDYIVHQSNGENEYMSLGSSTVITGLIARIEALEAAAGGGE